MAENTFKLNLVTPEKLVYGEDVKSLVANGTSGSLGILPRHAPLLTSLEIGVLSVTDKDGSVKKYATSNGFLEVNNNEVTILVETAEDMANIDAKRALAAKERAQQRLAEKTHEIDLQRAELALKKAITRLKISGN